MKIIAFIMALLVLALSVIPCADNGIAVNDSKAKTEIAKSTTEKGGTHQDDCSPFCTCNCCAGFPINHFVASIQVILPYSEPTKTAYLPCEITEISLPIWQPPRLI
jgi:hypothetical protein